MGATDVEISQRWERIDYEPAAKDEIACQTGLKPIRVRPARRKPNDPLTCTLIVSFLEPTDKPWRLFGSSRLAQYIERSSLPSQCDKCWDFHARHTCDRQASCKRCGRRGHDAEACVALERCANCLGPHAADFAKCPARPKRSHGVIRRLTREEKSRARELGAQLSARRKEQYERVERSEQPERDATCSPGGVTEKTVTPGPDRKTASESTHLTPTSSAARDDGQQAQPHDEAPRRGSESTLSSTRTVTPPSVMMASAPEPPGGGQRHRSASPTKKRRIIEDSVSP
ncbi:endonuclease-reverse transcriptase domain-containing protein [Hirsutella rhossiliensis]